MLPHLCKSISQATEIDFAVAFIMATGLRLLLPDLHDALAGQAETKQFPARLRVLTSDDLDVTDPDALRLLLLLQDQGAQVRVYEVRRAPEETKDNVIPFRRPAATTLSTRTELPYFPNLKIARGHFRNGSAEAEEYRALAAWHGRLDPARHFIARTSGNSMDGGKQPIRDGDYLLQEHVSAGNAGSITGHVVAIERQDEGGDNQYLLRVVTKSPDGRYILKANNPDYRDSQASDEMQTLARLKALLGTAENTTEEIRRRVLVVGVGQRKLKLEHFERVGSALLRRRRLFITYLSKGKAEVTEREVSPQRLVHYRENWYLDAWCHMRNELRNFAVDSILRVEVIEKPAKEVSKRSVEEVLGPGYGIFTGTRVQWATLVFTPQRALGRFRTLASQAEGEFRRAGPIPPETALCRSSGTGARGA